MLNDPTGNDSGPLLMAERPKRYVALIESLSPARWSRRAVTPLLLKVVGKSLTNLSDPKFGAGIYISRYFRDMGFIRCAGIFPFGNGWPLLGSRGHWELSSRLKSPSRSSLVKTVLDTRDCRSARVPS